MGFTGLALGAMLARDRAAQAAATERAAAKPARAKNVIWIFLGGGARLSLWWGRRFSTDASRDEEEGCGREQEPRGEVMRWLWNHS